MVRSHDFLAILEAEVTGDFLNDLIPPSVGLTSRDDNPFWAVTEQTSEFETLMRGAWEEAKTGIQFPSLAG